MDKNKAARLRELGYKLHKTCGRCKHANISRGSSWGSCKEQTYFHDKHNRTMPLSINASGSCPQFKQHSLDDVHGFKEFECP
jgi:hypothetical protein